MKLIILYFNESSAPNNAEKLLLNVITKVHRLQITIAFHHIPPQRPNHHICKLFLGMCGTQSLKSKSRSSKRSHSSDINDNQEKNFSLKS